MQLSIHLSLCLLHTITSHSHPIYPHLHQNTTSYLTGDAKVVSQSLFLETPKGIYFRYLGDTSLSVRIELNVFDTAAVVLKSHLRPSVARGMRGTAGSGKGVRALLEHFSMSLCYDYNAPANKADFLLTTSPIATSMTHGRRNPTPKYSFKSTFKDDGNTANPVAFQNWKSPSVDLDVGRLDLISVPIPLPTAINPLQSGGRPGQGGSPYSVVFSYEDLLFVMNLAHEFIGLDTAGTVEYGVHIDLYNVRSPTNTVSHLRVTRQERTNRK